MIYWWLTELAGETASCGSCVKPTAPTVAQGFETIAVGDGATPITVVDQGSDPALETWQLKVKGCVPVRAMVTYLDGWDCDGCTTTDLTPKVVPYLVPGNSMVTFAQGLISKVEIVTIDSLDGDTPTATTSEVKVEFFWSKIGNPCCANYPADATEEKTAGSGK